MLNRFRVYKISKVNDAEISDIGPRRIETFWLRVSLLANVFTKSISAYLLLILRRGPRFIFKIPQTSQLRQSFGPKYLESRQNNGQVGGEEGRGHCPEVCVLSAQLILNPCPGRVEVNSK